MQVLHILPILLTGIALALAKSGGSHLSKRESERLSNILEQLKRDEDPAHTSRTGRQHNWFIPRTHRPPTVYIRRTTAPPPKPTYSPDVCKNVKVHTKVEQADPYSQFVCLHLNKDELTDQLKTAGGLAKRYAAVNASGACSFEDLTTDAIQRVPPPRPTDGKPPTTPATLRSNDEENKRRRRMRRSLPSKQGTLLRGCQGRGTRVDNSNNYRLCTECSATTRMADGVFPQYINEVVCKDTDLMCAARMGVCVQKVLKLSFIRKTNKFKKDEVQSLLRGIDVFKEVWEEYTQLIRSCCECTVFPHVLNSFASKSAAETDA